MTRVAAIAASAQADSPAPAAETYGYTPGTNRLASVATASGTRSIAYDDRGNTASESLPGGGSVSVTYDGYGRLLTYTRSGHPAQSNVHNGLDDRVAMTSGGVTRAYVYDADGRLIGEYGSSASDVIAETIWLHPEVAANDNAPLGGDDGIGGYAPLAVAAGSGTSAALHWVHANHMGVPLLTTDASGATVTPTGYTMPGFPGQLRTLADLYYNRHRDYDTTTGRYIQADPIGLEGGNNPYLYANANPLAFVDPEGLSGNRGGRGQTGGSSGQNTPNKYKHCRNHPTDPSKIICKHKTSGKWIPKPKPADWPKDPLVACDGNCRKTAEVITVGAAVYVVYRCLRMIPSLFPPLWPTIVPNAVTP